MRGGRGNGGGFGGRGGRGGNGGGFTGFSAPKKKDNLPTLNTKELKAKYKEELSQIKNMGFSNETYILNSLNVCKGDVEAVVNYLLLNPPPPEEKPEVVTIENFEEIEHTPEEWFLLQNNDYLPSLHGHTCHVFDNKLVFIGGIENNKKENTKFNKKVHSLDLKSKKWSILSDYIPIGLINHTSVLYKDKIYILGGETEKGFLSNKFISFDLNSSEFDEVYIQKNFKPRSDHASCVFNNKMFVFGGKDSDGASLNDLWEFNFETKKWIELEIGGTKPTHGIDCCMCAAQNKILIVGGSNGSSVTNELYSINLLEKELKFELRKESKSIHKFQGGSLCKNDERSLVLFGGVANDSTYFDNIYYYHIDKNEWEEIISPKEMIPRFSHTAVVLNNLLIVYGGSNSLTSFEDLYAMKLQQFYASNSLFRLFYEGLHHDCVVKFDNIEFKLHKMILVQSDYLESMLEHGSEIFIHDFTSDQFQKILPFFYGYDISVEGTNALDLVYLSKLLEFEELEVYIINQLSDLSANEILDLLRTTDEMLRSKFNERFSQDNLKRYCFDFIHQNSKEFDNQECQKKIQSMNEDLRIELVTNSFDDKKSLLQMQIERKVEFDSFLVFLKSIGEYTDGVLISKDGKKFPIHKILLFASSIMDSFNEKNEYLFDVSHETLKALVDYLYFQEVEVSPTIEKEVKLIADKIGLGVIEELGGILVCLSLTET
jgi:N-acetylneuraminic acid mutarotase